MGLIVDLSAQPYLPKGWRGIKEHRNRSEIIWHPSKVRLHLSQRQLPNSARSISGEQLLLELKKLPIYNANLLDFFLQHKNIIPEDWKDKKIFFWGTIYKRPDGYLCVRCLDWRNGNWEWNHFWLGRDWTAAYPAAIAA
jgi:hypothetical protein